MIKYNLYTGLGLYWKIYVLICTIDDFNFQLMYWKMFCCTGTSHSTNVFTIENFFFFLLFILFFFFYESKPRLMIST